MQRKLESSQKKHYDEIAEMYADHYGDEYSQKYRKVFIYDRLFRGENLANQLVLEALCGGGEATEYLINNNANVIGLDISLDELKIFKKRWINSDAICCSAYLTAFGNEVFDSLVVIGGLHHLQPEINQGISEFHRVLKKGGTLYLCEPHKNSIPDLFRKIWYRFDNLFMKNESSIDIKKLINANSNLFNFEVIGYFGGLAYLSIYNSMILRIPIKAKKIYAPVLLKIESLYMKSRHPRLSYFVLIKAKAK